jgi:hypothetical protein
MFGEPIFSYTAQDALDDGVFQQPFPKEYPGVLLTEAVSTACLTKNDGRTFNQCAFPLVMDAVMAVQAKKNPKDGFWKLEETVAGTVWIFPNEFGSITIMKPEEY